jgi:proteasome lid subunit RPN8/RPN11
MVIEGKDSAIRTWSAPHCPYTVEYSARVLDDIRLAVVDAFFSLPKGGAEIGGILLGKYADHKVSVLDHHALDCEHAMGPSFMLSPKDIESLTQLIEKANSSGVGLSVVGWYHSHTRSDIFLSQADQEIHQRFFPEPWQTALVIKPHTFEPARGGFFFREADGSIKGEASPMEFLMEPLAVRQLPSGEVPAVAASRSLHAPSAGNGPVITLAPANPAETSPEPPITREFEIPASLHAVTVVEQPRVVEQPVVVEQPRVVEQATVVEPAPVVEPLERAAAAPETQAAEPAVSAADAVMEQAPAVEPQKTETAAPTEAPATQAAVPVPAAAESWQQPKPVPVEIPVRTPIAEAANAAVPVAAEQTLPEDLPAPEFMQIKPEKTWTWMRGGLALAAGLAIGLVGYQTRELWFPSVAAKAAPLVAKIKPGLPKEPEQHLSLVTSDKDGQLQIQWDAKVPAVTKAPAGRLLIADGTGKPREIALDPAHLRNGSFTYGRSSERVDVTMVVDSGEGEQLKDVTSFMGKLPERPAPPPAPEDPAIRKERDDLRQESAKLKQDLAAQAARTRKLEKDLNDVREQLKKEERRRLGNQAQGK